MTAHRSLLFSSARRAALGAFALAAVGLVALTPPPAAARGAAGAYLAARQAEINGDFEIAARYYSRALAYNRNQPLLLERALIARTSAGQIERAARIARRMRGLGLYNPLASAVLAAEDFAEGRYDQIPDRLRRTPSRPISAATRDVLLEWAAVGRGDAEAPGRIAGMASAYFPPHNAQTHAALAHAALGEVETAQDAFLTLIAESERFQPRVYELFGSVMEGAGRPDVAAAVYDEALALRPNDGLFKNLRGRLDVVAPDSAEETASETASETTSEVAGETAVAEETQTDAAAPATPIEPATAVRAAGPAFPITHGAAEAFYAAGVTSLTHRDFRRGLAYLRIALWLNPDMLGGHIMTGAAQERLGFLESAARTYASTLHDSVYRRLSDLARVDVLDRLERSEEALKILDGLIADAPQDADLYESKGDLLRREKSYAEAVVAYNAVIDIAGGVEARHWRLLYSRGICHERLGQWPQAERDFLEALSFEPDNAYVLNYLGYSWVEMGVNLDEAQEMIRQAVDLRPNDGYIVDSLGWVLYQLEDFEGAARHLERAAALQPTDPVINDHLGDALWKIGRRVEARFQWSRALSFDPEDDVAVIIRRKLEVGLDVVEAEQAAADAAEAAETAAAEAAAETASDAETEVHNVATPLAPPGFIAEFAPAKVNLFLHVTGRRADGYHLLHSLAAFPAIGDLVEAEPARGLSLAVAGPFGLELGADDDNLALRAAAAARASWPQRAWRGVAVGEKPAHRVGNRRRFGGRGGDSTGGVGAMARADLPETALALGADVPVCVESKAAMMAGVGDVVTPLAAPLPGAVVLVNPLRTTPTAAVFQAMGPDDFAPSRAKSPARFADAAALAAWLRPLDNTMTKAATALRPEIADVIAAVAAQPGCLLARMSGSGATAFGLFGSLTAATAAEEAVRRAAPQWWVASGALDHRADEGT